MQNLDVIGVLYSADEEPVALPGWHVNSPFPVEEWEQYQVTPTTPRRVFAGHPTYCYVFESKEAFVALTEPEIAEEAQG